MLKESLTKALADVYAFSLRLKYYHWNVEGKDFKQFHDLFDQIYDDVYGSVDDLAELIRTIDEYVPASLQNFKDLTEIQENALEPDGIVMCLSAIEENAIVTVTLLKVYEEAVEKGELGISNFIQNRIHMHEKHKWFLNSITKGIIN